MIFSRNNFLIKKYKKRVNSLLAVIESNNELTNEEHKLNIKNDVDLNSKVSSLYHLFRNILNISLYHNQLIAILSILDNKIVELDTGEGKTFVAAFSAIIDSYYNRKINIITFNEYLSNRDYLLIKPIYDFLGIEVGFIKENQHSNNIITYSTAEQIVFNYLNNDFSKNQNQFHFDKTIIDEIDSILIDEAQDPYIISQERIIDKNFYNIGFEISKELKLNEHYYIDKENILFLNKGIEYIENYMLHKNILGENSNIFDSENIIYIHFIMNALKAKEFFHKYKEYITPNDQILLIDKYSGRTSSNRKLSDGLHQAIEIKEDVTITHENSPCNMTTFQNFFMKYKNITGMSGSIFSSKDEIYNLYGVNTLKVPRNKENITINNGNLILRNKNIKKFSVVEKIEKEHLTNRPILLVTSNIHESIEYSELLKELGVKHNLLNAMNDYEEAEIIKQAGRLGRVTVSTNMSGRGVDIKIGKNSFEKEVIKKLGGLLIIATDKFETERLEKQIIGRTGRQGEPGECIFYLSLEDELLEENKYIEKIIKNNKKYDYDKVNKIFINKQKNNENENFSKRKQILNYDNVIEEHKKILLDFKNQINNRSYLFKEVVETIFNYYIEKRIKRNQLSMYSDLLGFKGDIKYTFNIDIENHEQVEDIIISLENNINKTFNLNITNFSDFDNIIYKNWIEHLNNMLYLKEWVQLKSYIQQNPLIEYKIEGYNYLEDTIHKIKVDIIKNIFNKKENKE